MESVSPVFRSIWVAYLFMRRDAAGRSDKYFVVVLRDNCIVAIVVGCVVGVSSPGGEWMKGIDNDRCFSVRPDVVVSGRYVRKR